MAPRKSRGPGNFQWSEEHRLALYLLKTEYELSADDEVCVFRQVFGTENMTKSKMGPRWTEHGKAAKSHLWQFRNDESPEVKKRRQLMQERIFSAIAGLGIEEVGDLRLERLSLLTPSKAQKRTRRMPSRQRSSYDLGDEDYEPPSKRTRVEPDGGTTEEFQNQSADQLALTNDGGANAGPTERPRTPKTPRRETATFLYDRPIGPLMLTSEEFEKTKEPLQWPETEVPLPVLVFRYSVACEGSCEPSCLCESGHFVARRFRGSFGMFDPPEAPSKQHPGSFWADAFHHLDNKQQDSPFVSVSDSLAWTLREAMKRTQNGSREVNISVITLDTAPVTGYYAPLFHQELKKRYLYGNWAWQYTGTNEYLIYYACKPMITIPLSRFTDWASKHVSVGEALRLAELGGGGTYYHHILANFKRQKVELTPVLARSIAKIGLSLFGFTAKTRAAVWQAFVANVCAGWALKPTDASSKSALANNFAHAILRKSNRPVDFQTQKMLKMAFLTGSKFATCDRMAIHKPLRFRQIEVRSKKVGLLSPAKILINEYDEVTVRISTYEEGQNEIIEKGKRNSLLIEANTAGADESDI